VTSNSAEFVYKCTNYYTPSAEHSLLWNDVSLGIEWPIIEGTEPLLSLKDKEGLPFDKAVYFD
jgi:dTDP-4-dehydrorhamnose 3,5-epimerase